MDRPLSDCCGARIVTAITQSRAGTGNMFTTKWDYCTKCMDHVQYATVGWFYGETMAVFRKLDGTLWFFWQQVSTWNEVLNTKQQYVGQVAEFVASIGADYNTQDVDMLSDECHKRFSNEWKKKVKNPEWAL